MHNYKPDQYIKLMEIQIGVESNSGLAGSEWFKICQKCQIEVAECCQDLEMILLPDELDQFLEKDSKHVKKYEDGTFGYKTKKCIFLLPSNECELQKTGKKKPLDCIIYPLNYKNNKLFLDTSCWAKRLLDINQAIKLVQDKLNQYPHYASVEYYIRESDIVIQDISSVTKKKDLKI